MKKFLLSCGLAMSLAASAVTVDLSTAAVGGAFNPPDGWGVAQTGATFFSVTHGAVHWSLYGYGEGYGNTIICTPCIEGAISFDANVDEADWDDEWGMVPAGTLNVYEYAKDGNTYTRIRKLGSPDANDSWEPYSYTVAQGNCVGFELNGASIRCIQYELADITGASVRISSLDAGGDATVNYDMNITVGLVNRSGETIAPGTYTVELLNGNQVIATQTATPELINSTTLSFEYTPHEAGVMALSARLTMGEEVVTSDPVNVTVQPESTRDDIIVGAYGSMVKGGSAALTSPICNWDKKTWCQMVLTADYLDQWGLTPGATISGLTFFGSTGSARSNVTMKVYMSSTELTSINPEQAVTVDLANEVYNSVTYSWPQLGNSSTPVAFPDIMFDTPYTYEGGNLLLIIYKEIASYDGSTYMVQDTDLATQAIIRSSDTNVNDAPWKQCAGLGQLDFIVDAPAPVFSGVVKDQASQNPLADAQVVLTSGNVLYSGTTGEDGTFAIDVYQATRDYDVTVSRDQYANYTGTVSLADGDVERTIELVSDVGDGVKSLTADGINVSVQRDMIAVSADAALTIYGMNGTMAARTQGNAISTRNLNAGVYILKVATAEGETTVRFIKK